MSDNKCKMHSVGKKTGNSLQAYTETQRKSDAGRVREGEIERERSAPSAIAST